MDLKGKLKQGMRIFGSDDREYGTIERYDDQNVYVGGRKVPYSAFDRMDKDRLYVGQSGARYFGDGREANTMTTEDALRVPVVEERLDVSKRQVELGEVEVRKTVESEQVSVPIELMREQVEVHSVNTADRMATEAELADGFKEGTIRVPVRGEEAVVRKETMVTGEVVIDRERTTERETVSDTVRKERVTVDEDYDKDRTTVRQETRTQQDTRAPRASEATTERTVETARPAARREGDTGDGDSWEELRGDIRDASEQSRR